MEFGAFGGANPRRGGKRALSSQFWCVIDIVTGTGQVNTELYEQSWKGLEPVAK